MPKRIGNTQIPSTAGLTDIINLKQHKNFVEQGIFPSTDNHVVNSLRFDGSSYLSFTPSSNSNSGLWTYSVWVKLSDFSDGLLLGASPSSWQSDMRFGSGELQFFDDGGRNFNVESSMLFRDTSSFYHIVTVVNSSLSNANDRIKIYVNGSKMVYSTNAQGFSGTDVSGGATKFNNSSYAMRIGGRSSSVVVLDGYLATVNFIDGQALSPTDFGYYNRSTGQWKPKKYTGTYGANGFLLEFKDSSNVGKDTSGNGNDWNGTGFASSDFVSDSPANTFATLNPLPPSGGYLNQGNLQVQGGSNSNGRYTVPASLNLGTTGKWYWEVFVHTVGYECQLGMQDAFGENSSQLTGANAYSFYFYNGNWYSRGTANSLGTAYGSGSLISFFYDADTLQISVFKDNNLQGSAQTVTASTYTPAVMYRESNGQSNLYVNFGQDPTFADAKTGSAGPYSDANGIGAFYYQPPTGALALCTQNLPAPTIEDPEKFFKAITYDGDGATKTISSLTFQPDLVWQKSRDDAYLSAIIDSVRGDNKIIVPSSTSGERTPVVTSGEPELAILSNGFKVTHTLSGTGQNASGKKQIAWCWKAGGASTTDNVANGGNPGQSPTAGSVKIDGADFTSSLPTADIYPIRMSIGTRQQFSITKYRGNQTSGAVIGHGLSSTPDFIIIKSLDQAGTWITWTPTLGAGRILGLNNNLTRTAANTAYFNSTLPNASVVTLGYDGAGNEMNDDNLYIMYCWRAIEGFSAFGSYEGNGVVDGPFVYLGFKPAFLMLKNIDDATDGYSSWYMADSVRSVNNPAGASNTLFANEAYIEGKRGNGDNIGTNNWLSIDFLSNGFKVRAESNYETNQEDKTYIYMAFADQPTNFTTAR